MVTVDIKIKIPEKTKQIMARMMDKRRIMTPFKQEFGKCLIDFSNLCKHIMEKNIRVKRKKYKKIMRKIRAIGPVVRGNEIHGHYCDLGRLNRITARDSDIPLVNILEEGHKAFVQSGFQKIPWENITPWRRIYKPKGLSKGEQKEQVVIARRTRHKAYPGIYMFEQTNKAIESFLPKRLETILHQIITTGKSMVPRFKISTARL